MTLKCCGPTTCASLGNFFAPILHPLRLPVDIFTKDAHLNAPFEASAVAQTQSSSDVR